jgi:hypothetical protein
MPEVIRSVVARVRVFFNDRRQSPRLRLSLPFNVSIHRDGELNGSKKRAQTLKGHTRDIGQKGIALLVPQVHLDGYHLAAGGRELNLELELYRGKFISMRVAPRRYERLEEAESGCTYLIGARIVNMSDEDRSRYQVFLTEHLKKAPRLSHNSQDEDKASLELLK